MTMMIRAAASLMGRHLVLFVVLADDELETMAAAEPRRVHNKKARLALFSRKVAALRLP